MFDSMFDSMFEVEEVEAKEQRHLVVALHLLTLVLLGLHLVTLLLPPSAESVPEPHEAESAWWGLWPVRYAPSWSIALAGVLILGLLVAFWWRELADRSAQRAATGQSSDYRTLTMAVLGCISLSLFVAFFLFPVVHTRWGDAYMLAKSIAWPDLSLRLTHSWQAPLDVFLHSRVWLALHEQYGWQDDATGVYRLLSPLAGGLYLLVLLALSRDEHLAPAWLTYGLLASLGLIQLFFGYVENYSFAAVGVLAYLWLGINVARGERQLWLAASTLAVTHAIHPSTIVLSPSLLYLGWLTFTRDRSRNAGKQAISVTLQIALPMMVVAGVTVVLMEQGGHGINALLTSDRPGGGDARWLVPLWETTTRWEQYTLFSWPHLRDFVNEQLLVAPVVLPSLLLTGFFSLRHRVKSPPHPLTPSPYRPITRFLLLATLLYLLFTWLWNPDYGGQRDRDLFSLAALPSTLLLVAVLPIMLPNRWYLVMGAVPLILVQSLHTAAWIYQNTLPWSWP